MDERLVAAIKALLPPGSDVLKIYKSDAGDIKVDVSVGGAGMTCSLKKNHAGELYLD